MQVNTTSVRYPCDNGSDRRVFLAGVGLGVGVGLALGLILGHLLMQVGLDTIQDTIAKVTYSIRFPSPQTAPVQTEAETQEAFRDLEADDEKVPDWMDEEYTLR